MPTKRLNEQVRRNRERFPDDFMFRLDAEEEKLLRSQIATSKIGRGGRRHAPYAFTEHGAIMSATVRSEHRLPVFMDSASQSEASTWASLSETCKKKQASPKLQNKLLRRTKNGREYTQSHVTKITSSALTLLTSLF